MKTVRYNQPKDLAAYENKYILFYSSEADPKVLFSSSFPEEAYEEAQRLFRENGKMPVLERVSSNDSQFFNCYEDKCLI